MWRHSNSWLARLLRWLRCPDRADQHNKEALCVMPPPDFETASPAELVKFYNRAGGRGAGSDTGIAVQRLRLGHRRRAGTLACTRWHARLLPLPKIMRDATPVW